LRIYGYCAVTFYVGYVCAAHIFGYALRFDLLHALRALLRFTFGLRYRFSYVTFGCVLGYRSRTVVLLVVRIAVDYVPRVYPFVRFLTHVCVHVDYFCVWLRIYALLGRFALHYAGCGLRLLRLRGLHVAHHGCGFFYVAVAHTVTTVYTTLAVTARGFTRCRLRTHRFGLRTPVYTRVHTGYADFALGYLRWLHHHARTDYARTVTHTTTRCRWWLLHCTLHTTTRLLHVCLRYTFTNSILPFICCRFCTFVRFTRLRSGCTYTRLRLLYTFLVVTVDYVDFVRLRWLIFLCCYFTCYRSVVRLFCCCCFVYVYVLVGSFYHVLFCCYRVCLLRSVVTFVVRYVGLHTGCYVTLRCVGSLRLRFV